MKCEYNSRRVALHLRHLHQAAVVMRSVTAYDIDETKRLEGRPMCQEHADRCIATHDQPEWEVRYERIALDKAGA